MPVLGDLAVGPVHVLGPDGAALLAAVRSALPESERGYRDRGPAFTEVLAAAGVGARQLAGCVEVLLEELSDGSFRVTGAGIENHRPTGHRTWREPGDGLAGACAAAAVMLREMPSGHPPVGMPTGAGFGIKRSWLVVRDRSVAEVVAAVGLDETRAAGWDEGVGVAFHDGPVFVSPPVEGWTFVVNPHGGGALAAELSARLGTEVQFFGNHRVAAYAEWARAVDGRLVRHVYAFEDDEDCREVGEPTPVEIGIGFSAGRPGAVWPEQEDVLRVAGDWSIDPETLSLRESAPGDGVLGVVR